MSLVDYEEREERLDALTKPMRWAGETALIVGAGCLLMMSDKSVSWETVAIVATGGLIVSSGFFLWGYARIMNAARGRG
jgi:hypothetical protein